MKNYRLIGLSVAALSLFAFASLEGCTTSTDTDGDTDGGADGSSNADGSSGSSGTGGTNGDGGSDSSAGARGTGSVLANFSDLGATTSFTFGATFAAATTASTETGCTTTTEGDCTVRECTITPPSDAGTTDAGTVVPPNAGDVKLTGGGLPGAGVTTTPYAAGNDAGAEGTYEFKTLSSTVPWDSSNKNMSVAATGATVPAFTKDITAPLVVTATAPTFAFSPATSLPRANDLTVTWTGGTGSGGKTIFSLLHSTTTKSTTATCSFDPAGGTGTVKAAVLGKFPAGATGVTGTVSTVSTETVAAGDYDVAVVLTSSAKAGASIAFGQFDIP